MLKQIYGTKFENYDFLKHTIFLDSRDGSEINFENYKSGPDAEVIRGLSKDSLEVLAEVSYAPSNATHVHIGDSRRVCLEGKHAVMDDYTAYAVAYFKEKPSLAETKR